MKKIFKSLLLTLLVTSSVFAETVMCPETITCNNESETCNLPKDFFISDYFNGANSAVFNGDLTLNFVTAYARKTLFLEKKATQKNFALECIYSATVNNSENQFYKTIGIPISVFVNKLNFTNVGHRFPSTRWNCGFNQNGTFTPYTNPIDCAATK